MSDDRNDIPARGADHLLALAPGWQLWRTVLVRSPGFPASLTRALADARACDAADRFHAVETKLPSAMKEAEAALASRVAAGEEDCKRARSELARLRRKRWSHAETSFADSIPAVERLASLAREADSCACAYAEGVVRTAEALVATASMPRFREALVWQNRNAVRTGLDWLRTHPYAPNNDVHRKLHLLASYLQRYALKNDTIGFFGPVAWADVGNTTSIRPGPGLVGQRQVYLEHWALDRVAHAIASIEGIRPYLAPRLVPTARVSGTVLTYGFGKRTQVPAVVARLLAQCTGRTAAIDIALSMLASDPDLGTVSDIYEMLDELVAHKLVTWTIELSVLVHPERELRALVNAIPDANIRERASSLLSRIESARDGVAKATGDAAALESALGALEAVFEEVTGASATRRGGETYAGRTMIVEECVRELAVTIDKAVFQRIAPVLALIGESARWFTNEIAAKYRAAACELYRTQRPDGGGIPYLEFVLGLGELLPPDRPSPIGLEIKQEFHRRWDYVLQLDMSQRHVELSMETIADRSARAFDAPAAGWPMARYVSPDVMFAAAGPDAFARGDFTAVIGEVHVGNSLFNRVFMAHGPDENDALARARERDLPEAAVLEVAPRDAAHRAQKKFWSARDMDLEITARSWRPRDQVVRAGDLEVYADDDSGLRVRDVSCGRTFDIMTFLEGYVAFLSSTNFKPAPQGPHVPRVTIEGVVLCRESWTFLPEQFPSVTETRGVAQFGAMRAWARRLGLPRLVFVKVPEEKKPVFIDFDSPLYVEMLAKLLRKASRVTISEMLPSIDECWLPDAEHNTYTAELRMVMLDERR